jgi:hypothetical protein
LQHEDLLSTSSHYCFPQLRFTCFSSRELPGRNLGGGMVYLPLFPCRSLTASLGIAPEVSRQMDYSTPNPRNPPQWNCLGAVCESEGTTGNEQNRCKEGAETVLGDEIN